MGLLREQCAEWKKVHLLYCCNQAWMRNGGQIPWNAITICGTFKIFGLMGRLHMRDFWENRWKDRSFHLVHWLSITLSLRRTSQESISLERKSYLKYSLDTLCTRWRIWKGDIMVTDVEELETMDASEIDAKKTQCKGSNISWRKRKIHIPSRRWTNKIRWRRSGTENVHLDMASTNSRRRSKRFSRESEGSPPPQRQDYFRMPVKHEMILVHFRNLHVPPSRWIQFQTLLSEREESFPIPLKYIDVQNYADKLGCYARKPHWWLLEYRWIKRFVWFLDRFHPVYSIKWETFRRIYMVRGGDWQNGKRHPGQIIYGQRSGEECQRTLSWGRSINGQFKDQSSIMQ